jgi:hypothetical protein
MTEPIERAPDVREVEGPEEAGLPQRDLDAVATVDTDSPVTPDEDDDTEGAS